MIQKIYLVDFRNFSKRLFEFSDATTIIVGENAVGKTNILEAINLLSTGKSFKAQKEEEMVNYSAEIARVNGLLADDNKTKLEVVLTRGKISVGGGADRYRKVAKKKLMLGGVSKRLIDFSGQLKTVVFAPSDMDLVTESPSVRRKFLDNVLSLTDREYKRALSSYEKGLRQRNKLLYAIRDGVAKRGQLLFWNTLLIKNADYIASQREKFIDFMNETKSFNGESFRLVYDKSAISESRLEQYRNEEVAAATTLVGPHRDDILFEMEKKGEYRRLDSFGSRGEQRMAVLWSKLAEVDFIKKQTGDKPTLLLDDIFSELDHKHRKIVMDVARTMQTIITTADPHFIEDKKVEVIKI